MSEQVPTGVLRRMEIRPTLANCEAVIRRAFEAYVEARHALQAIRGGRLHKQTHNSFDAYCRERWGWSRQRACQLIEAARVHDVLEGRLVEAGGNGKGSTMVDTPRSERVARELAPLRRRPKLLEEAWTQVVERHGPEVEARHVRRLVRELVPATTTAAPPQERTFDDTVRALRRLMDNGHDVRLLREALNAIDPDGRNR